MSTETKKSSESVNKHSKKSKPTYSVSLKKKTTTTKRKKKGAWKSKELRELEKEVYEKKQKVLKSLK